jgi:chemotaxis signal transduction protein
MNLRTQRFVLFPLGKKRFALPAAEVSELSRPDELQTFPHNTNLLAGVLMRRGKIVPVLDVAQVVIGPNAPQRRFYLIANRRFERDLEWTAIPVTGECELTSAEVIPPTGKLPQYVTGLLSLDDEIVEIIDLNRLAATEAA